LQLENLGAMRLAAKLELRTPATMMESVRLMRIGPDQILRHRDGISINGRMPRVLASLGQFDRSLPPADGSPAMDQAIKLFDDDCMTAMGFVWISSARNGRVDQINTGRAYVRQQLQATALGVGLHPLSQALQEFGQMAPHDQAVHQLLLGQPAPRGPNQATVQMLCQVGYPSQAIGPTPRRPLAQFVKANQA
jgi:hypothetical protein